LTLAPPYVFPVGSHLATYATARLPLADGSSFQARCSFLASVTHGANVAFTTIGRAAQGDRLIESIVADASLCSSCARLPVMTGWLSGGIHAGLHCPAHDAAGHSALH
jgi:hypothetical protein